MGCSDHTQKQDGEEIDYMQVPYKSSKLDEMLGGARAWFPLAPGRSACVLVRHRPSNMEVEGKVEIRNKWQTWVTHEGVAMRAKDAIRAMMASCETDDA